MSYYHVPYAHKPKPWRMDPSNYPTLVSPLFEALVPIKLPDWAKPKGAYQFNLNLKDGAVAITETVDIWDRKAVKLFRGP